MSKVFYFRLSNMALRAITLLSKFVLIFFLAGYLTASELGLYGLILATVGYASYPLGFEFFTYSIREIVIDKNFSAGNMLKSQMLFYLILYSIFLPLFIVFFLMGFIPSKFIVVFYLLVILEHINIELTRVLIAMSKQLQASFAIFFRQGLWAVLVVVLMYLYTDLRKLDTVLYGWLAGASISLLICIAELFKLNMKGWKSRVDWIWIKRGLKVATPYFFAALSIGSVNTFDKYIYDFINGSDALGAYVFYFALSASVISFLDAGVFSFTYPELIKLAENKDYARFNSAVKNMFIIVIAFCSIFFLSAYFLIDYILMLIGKEVFSDNKVVFYILLISVFFNVLGVIPQYALYAYNKDKHIFLSGMSSFFIFLFFVFCFYFIGFNHVVPLSLCCTFLVLFLWKFFVYYKFYLNK